VILAVLVVAVVVGVSVGAWSASRRRPAPITSSPMDPSDVADLAARFDGVDAQHSRYRDALLAARLLPLVTRRVPVRTIEPLADRKTTRVRFADGTAVVVRGHAAGDTGVLAAVVRKQAVLPGTCSTDADGTHLVFDWSGGRHHLSVLVTGLDQPD
jgi:hypothetical protein